MQLHNLDDITTNHRHIFLSPHLDDVVYSCGGTLGVQVSSGLHPLVITVFAGIPGNNISLSHFAQEQHRKWGADSQAEPGQIMLHRRREDAAALDYLQTDYLWLDYLEAIYRGKPTYYNSDAQIIGGNVHVHDQQLEQELSQLLLSLRQRLPDTIWYAPLGIGKHVDHQIVCSAADRLVQDGATVYFYEDFPYVRQEGALQKRITELGSHYEPNLVEISEYLPARIDAAKVYGSQIVSNFGKEDALSQAMDSYSYSIRPVETIRLERYWTPR